MVAAGDTKPFGLEYGVSCTGELDLGVLGMEIDPPMLPTAPTSSLTKHTRHDAYSSYEDENHIDNDADFGFADEEDRTLMARSRHAALSSSSSDSPSPPVPALPTTLALSNNPTSLSNMGTGDISSAEDCHEE